MDGFIQNRRNLLSFFLLTFLVSWSIWILGYLFFFETRFIFFPIGAMGPAIAALILKKRKSELSSVVSSLKPHRIQLNWIMVIIFAVPVAMMLPLIYYIFKNDPIPISFIFDLFPSDFEPWYIIPLLPLIFPMFLVGNFGEEIGWRGYALEKIGTNHGFFLGSIILGALNAIWHIPLYFLIENPLYNPFNLLFIGFFIFEIGYTLLVTVVWLNTRKTIFIGLLVHTTVTVCSIFLPTWENLTTLLLSGVLINFISISLFYLYKPNNR